MILGDFNFDNFGSVTFSCLFSTMKSLYAFFAVTLVSTLALDIANPEEVARVFKAKLEAHESSQPFLFERTEQKRGFPSENCILFVL